MTPQEKLKEIKDEVANKYDIVPRVSVKWLVARVEQLEKEIEDVLWINDCHCDEAYTKRHMHAPNAICGELDELKEALNEGPKPE